MAIAILVGRNQAEQQSYKWFIDAWRQALLNLEPNLDIRVWPDIDKKDEIDFALVWKHAIGSLTEFPRLKGIASLAAGVDHVMADPNISTQVPLSRVVDPYMANDIVQYVTCVVLNYIKRMDHWRAKQALQTWFKQPPFAFSDQTIGIMGLGFLGSQAAQILHQLGLKVIGWSNSVKQLSGIKSFAGKHEFNQFLAETNVLVCMLPLTPDTTNILNQDTFARLKPGAYLVNVGRGEQLVEEDLLKALDAGQLSGASLDVFREEPLPTEHPFWQHPALRITPHIASVTNPETAAPQVLANYQRAIAGETMLNLVDVTRGY